jgi:hypothetical protein
VWLLLLDIPAKFVLFTWVFLHTRGSVLVAALFHGSTNLFTVSPAVSVTGDLVFPVIATAAKWLLVLLAKWLLVLLLVALTRCVWRRGLTRHAALNHRGRAYCAWVRSRADSYLRGRHARS